MPLPLWVTFSNFRFSVDYLTQVKQELKERTPAQLTKRALKLFGAGDVEKALTLLDKALLVYPRSVRLLDARIAILREIKAYGRALPDLRAAVDRRRAKLKKKGYAIASKKDHLGREGRILISGFFYSGSGAVLDYLKGFEGVRKFPFVAGESRVVKFPGGIAEMGKVVTVAGRLRSKEIVRFYLHLVGKQIVQLARGLYHQDRIVNRNNRRLLKNKDSLGYFYQALQLLEDYWALAKKKKLSHDDFVTASRAGLVRMLDAAALQNKVTKLVVDQIVTAWRIPIAQYMPPSSFIIVHRDPRDQYAEVKAALSHPGRRVWSAAEFVKTIRDWRTRVDRHVATLESKYGHRVLRVAFEDFVLDHEKESARVRDFVGLPLERMNEQRFFPEVSSANVGKYASLLTPEEIRCIEAGLPEFLYRPRT